MPPPGVALDRLGFLTIGLFDGDNPGPGHQTTLEIIELGERLGFDSAWVRNRTRTTSRSCPAWPESSGRPWAGGPPRTASRVCR
ncbi:MAG: hypothetical protein ABSF03_31365 [Streptosporangiaceae bacterium]